MGRIEVLPVDFSMRKIQDIISVNSVIGLKSNDFQILCSVI